jgi:DNA-binding transcriptional ArsR family regulator
MAHGVQGGASPAAIDAATAADVATAMQALRVLRHLGLVVGARRGRHVVYELHDDHVAALVDEAVFHVEHLRLGFRGRSRTAAGGLSAAAAPGR